MPVDGERLAHTSGVNVTLHLASPTTTAAKGADPGTGGFLALMGLAGMSDTLGNAAPAAGIAPIASSSLSRDLTAGVAAKLKTQTKDAAQTTDVQPTDTSAMQSVLQTVPLQVTAVPVKVVAPNAPESGATSAQVTQDVSGSESIANSTSSAARFSGQTSRTAAAPFATTAVQTEAGSSNDPHTPQQLTRVMSTAASTQVLSAPAKDSALPRSPKFMPQADNVSPLAKESRIAQGSNVIPAAQAPRAYEDATAMAVSDATPSIVAQAPSSVASDVLPEASADLASAAAPANAISDQISKGRSSDSTPAIPYSGLAKTVTPAAARVSESSVAATVRKPLPLEQTAAQPSTKGSTSSGTSQQLKSVALLPSQPLACETAVQKPAPNPTAPGTTTVSPAPSSADSMPTRSVPEAYSHYAAAGYPTGRSVMNRLESSSSSTPASDSSDDASDGASETGVVPAANSVSASALIQYSMPAASARTSTAVDLSKASQAAQPNNASAAGQSSGKQTPVEKASPAAQNKGSEQHVSFDYRSAQAEVVAKVDVAAQQAPAAVATAAPANNISSTVVSTATDHSQASANTAAAMTIDDGASQRMDAPAMAPLGTLQTARLVEHASGVDMQMGIHAGEFGKVDIHTSVNQGQMSARIYVEHNDLGKAMADSLPQLHEKLFVEHRMDAQIQLYNTSSGHPNGTDRQQQQQQQQQQSTQEQGTTEFQNSNDFPQADAMQELSSMAAAGGLDMHA